jgi:hypothetical protein
MSFDFRFESNLGVRECPRTLYRQAKAASTEEDTPGGSEVAEASAKMASADGSTHSILPE